MSVAVCHRISAYLSGRPLYMEPYALKAAIDAVGPRLALSGIRAMDDGDRGDGTGPEESWLAEQKRLATTKRLATIVEAEYVPVAEGMGEYGLTADGVAIVCIAGTLVNRFDWLAAWCGFVSYDSLGLTIDAAVADERVKAILLDVDSPGGEAAGMLDCADKIRAAADAKPVWAVANTLAASAGYGLAAAAKRLVLPRLASVGSIGVVAVHVDQSAADEKNGLKFTALYSGARKIDGWGHAPLADGARKNYQAQLDEARRKFAEAVGVWRGVSTDAVLKTEAAVYDDDAAIGAKLADDVMPFDEALAELTEQVRSGGSSSRGIFAAQSPAPAKETTMKQRGKAATAAQADAERKAADSAPAPENEPETAPENEGGESEGEGGTPEKPAAEAAKPGTVERAAAAEIVRLCTAAGQPAMAADLIADGATVEQAKAKIDAAGEVRRIVASARKINATIPESLADELLAVGATAADARKTVLERLEKAQSPDIHGHHASSRAKATIDTGDVYARWNAPKAR